MERVMSSEDREKQFERGLARHLRGGSPDAACPDAEMLAAYHERTFSQEEMEQWKQHIVGCARCQETLALVESSEVAMREEWPEEVVAAPGYQKAVVMPAQAATVSGEKETVAGGAAQVVAIKDARSEKNAAARRRILRWSAPAGAIAALLLLWLGVWHQQNAGRYPARTESQVAENRNSQRELPKDERLPQNEAKTADEKSAAAPIAKKFAPENYVALEKDTSPKPALPSMHMPEPSPGGAGRAAGASGGINGAVAGDKIARDKFDKQSQPEREATKLSRPSMPRRKSEGFAFGNGKGVAPPPALPSLSPAPLSSPPPQAAAEIADQSATGVGTTVDGGSASFGAARISPTPAKPPETRNKAKEEVPSSATQSVEVVSAAPAMDSTSAATQQTTSEARRDLPVNGRNYTELMSLAPGVVSNVIAAPKGKYGWRVGAGGLIKHSSDYGKTWKAQKSGVTADLISGSAPGEKICWVAGKAGTLLLTTDGGKHWKTVKAPVGSDLDRVQASDAQHARIWSMGNREVYETNNAGSSWAPVPQH
jgi:hypothetical protein